jgi:hypothetical protein
MKESAFQHDAAKRHRGGLAMPLFGHLMALNRQSVLGLTTEEGVYELCDGATIFYGAAVDDPHGIRGALESHMHGDRGDCTTLATHFRFEVNARAERRLEELLEEYVHEHGELPRCNASSTELAAKFGLDGPTAI